MTALGHQQTFVAPERMSAQPPKADEVDGSRSRHLVPRCECHQAFTSKKGAIRYADYHDRPGLGQERFSGARN